MADEQEEDENIIIIAMRYSEKEEFVPGYQQKCDYCSTKCHISYSTAKDAKSHNKPIKICCMQCLPTLQKNAEIKKSAIGETTVKELARTTGQSEELIRKKMELLNAVLEIKLNSK